MYKPRTKNANITRQTDLFAIVFIELNGNDISQINMKNAQLFMNSNCKSTRIEDYF